MPKPKSYDKHFHGVDDQSLEKLAERQQRSGNDLQRRAGAAMRMAHHARAELQRRKHGRGGEEE
ncbi:hypothetical protein [Pseudoxanthomonas mexicana]|uniref:hypothetical protein n=1 Tax=Pseudoxanthomonas mexicana TaxID=128785 RepID=UPI0028A841A0|nr:hypothetical protein [Pseudoxanthomonas mexicana]